MYMILVTRVVKIATGNTAQYAPRTTNQETKSFSGPFRTAKAAERTMSAILATHSCLDAVIWNEEQVREEFAKGSLYRMFDAANKAVKALDAVNAVNPVTMLG